VNPRVSATCFDLQYEAAGPPGWSVLHLFLDASRDRANSLSILVAFGDLDLPQSWELRQASRQAQKQDLWLFDDLLWAPRHSESQM